MRHGGDVCGKADGAQVIEPGSGIVPGEPRNQRLKGCEGNKALGLADRHKPDGDRYLRLDGGREEGDQHVLRCDPGSTCQGAEGYGIGAGSRQTVEHRVGPGPGSGNEGRAHDLQLGMTLAGGCQGETEIRKVGKGCSIAAFTVRRDRQNGVVAQGAASETAGNPGLRVGRIPHCPADDRRLQPAGIAEGTDGKGRRCPGKEPLQA